MNFLANPIFSSPYLGGEVEGGEVETWGADTEGASCILVCPGRELRSLGPWSRAGQAFPSRCHGVGRAGLGPDLTRYKLCEPEKSLPLGAFLETGEIRMPTDLVRQWRRFTEEAAANSPQVQAQEEGDRECLALGLGALPALGGCRRGSECRGPGLQS